MEALTVEMQAKIRKRSSERLRMYLIKAGRDEDEVMTWDRDKLMEEWALEKEKGRNGRRRGKEKGRNRRRGKKGRKGEERKKRKNRRRRGKEKGRNRRRRKKKRKRKESKKGKNRRRRKRGRRRNKNKNKLLEIL